MSRDVRIAARGGRWRGAGRRAGALLLAVLSLGPLLGLLLALSATDAARAQEARLGGAAALLDIDGAIGPATSDYLHRALGQAVDGGAAVVVLRLDTPGGLSAAMRDIIRDMLASPIPVIAYVAPSGARAASAGTYILYASQLAAMAPGTNLGAATPIRLGGGKTPLGNDGGDAEDGGDAAPADAESAKAINDAAAYIRSLAELHGRNADWAESAVRRAESLSADEALQKNVIEIVARDVEDLLNQADGRTVKIGGAQATLHTAGLRVVPLEPDWRTRLLAVITDPNIAYILMLVGIYGIVFEFWSPGAVAPGVVGAISLVVALFALNLLPINMAGAGLVLLGIALFVAEAFVPSFGMLGIGGATAFALGSVFLFQDVPGFGLSWTVIGVATGLTVAFFVLVIAAVVQAQRRRVASGDESLIGDVADVLTWSGEHGYVHVQGERWQARSPRPLAPGEKVRVRGRRKLVLDVEPDTAAEPEA